MITKNFDFPHFLHIVGVSLSPRPASKFFLFLALGLFCPQYHKFLKMIKGQLNVWPPIF